MLNHKKGSAVSSYSLFSGLKGVNSIVSVTGSHISGRRLSTPEQNQRKPSKPVQRLEKNKGFSILEFLATNLTSVWNPLDSQKTKLLKTKNQNC